jgi:Zn-dependent peptidase ImmA (M78 family)
MAQIIPLRKLQLKNPRREQLRLDSEDLLHMLLIINEQQSGGSVARCSLVPVDLLKLSSLLGVTIEWVEELGGVRLDNPWAERDVIVPGLLDRVKRRIVIAKKLPASEQRYTLAHELSHLLHHSSPRHLRERAAASVRSGPGKRSSLDEEVHKREERDAEIFASELLMPADVMEEAVVKRFGSRIDATIPHDDLAHFISVATHRTIHPRHLAQMPQIDRAKLFAEANNFGGRYFSRLYEHFEVSLKAMSIRLLELGLVI